MPRIVLLILTVIFSSPLFAKKEITVCGKVFSDENFQIQIFEPINGYFNQASVNVNANMLRVTKDSFFYSFTPLNDSPVFFTLDLISSNNSRFIGNTEFLAVPGDSIHIFIYPTIQGFKWVDFSGDNAAGNNLFQKINYSPSEKFDGLFDLLEILPMEESVFFEKIDAEIDQLVSQFKLLYKKHEVSLPYFNSMNKTLTMSFFNVVFSTLNHKSPFKDKISKKLRDAISKHIFKVLDPNDIELRPLYNSIMHFDHYYQFRIYSDLNMQELPPPLHDTSIIRDDKEYLISKNLALYLFIDDPKIQEDLWAIQICAFFQLAPGLYDETIIDQFDALFPNSSYLPYLKKHFKNTNNVKEIEYQAIVPIAFVDREIDFRSVEEVICKFRGKIVYVDLWASWCGPCIGSFAYNKTIDSFFKSNSIERLYISLDNNESQWKKAIENYQLGGYHVLVNKNLIDDIKKILEIENKRGIAIPHYLIYDKSGKLLFKNSYGPLDSGALFEQFNALIQ